MNVSRLQSQPLATPESPWLGIRSFAEDDQAFFFGRSAEVDDLYERILDKPLTVLFGQSGLGKTSLLNAALVPRLRDAGFLPVVIRFDHNSGAAALEQQLLEALHAALKSAGDERRAAMLGGALGTPENNLDYMAFLWLLLHDPARGFIPDFGAKSADDCRPVFLIDQFEEIFTLGRRPISRSVSASFCDSLATLVENRPPAALRDLLEHDNDLAERLDYRAQPTRVLISLREDHLHLLERWRRSMPSLMDNRFELRPLNGQQALRAIVRPGQLRTGMPPIIPDSVGQAIVRFLDDAGADVPLEEIDSFPPLLSLVSAELNAQRLVDNAEQVTQAQFDGHSKDILATFYFRSFDAATYGAALENVPGAQTALKALRRLVEQWLLSPDGFRQSITFDTIAHDLAAATEPEAARIVLDALVRRRLLAIEERGSIRRLELAHDVLVRVVKASRDERRDTEARLDAEAEKKLAETENARLRKQRNRLRALAMLASCLSIIAILAAVAALVGWKKADLAEARSDRRFETALAGLATLSDDFANKTLEDDATGITSRQAYALKSQLRTHLLAQLSKLHQEQPDHHGPLHYITRLQLDEGNQALANRDVPRAQHYLALAADSSRKWSPDNEREAETQADVLQSAAKIEAYNTDYERVRALAKGNLPKVSALATAWPDSWRLQHLAILLEEPLVFDGSHNRVATVALADRLHPLLKRSGNDFRLAKDYFRLQSYSLRDARSFPQTPAGFAAQKELIVWFREHLVETKPKYSQQQLESAVDSFGLLLSFVDKQLSQVPDGAAAKERRHILMELEKAIRALEIRLPRSSVVLPLRAKLLQQYDENGLQQGINTLSPDQLLTAQLRYARQVNSVMTPEKVADALSDAFKSGADANGLPNPEATLAAEAALLDFMQLHLDEVDFVMQAPDIVQAVAAIRKNAGDSELLVVHREMVERYIFLFQNASFDAKRLFLNAFAAPSSALVDEWVKEHEYQKVVELWRNCYEGLDKAGNTHPAIAHIKTAASAATGTPIMDKQQPVGSSKH